jgi:hypothetical protein
MTMRAIEDFKNSDVLLQRTRFVLVNERVPRAQAWCTVCCARIERGYVRDPHTRLLYCDPQCFAEHEQMTSPATAHHARKVS